MSRTVVKADNNPADLPDETEKAPEEIIKDLQAELRATKAELDQKKAGLESANTLVAQLHERNTRAAANIDAVASQRDRYQLREVDLLVEKDILTRTKDHEINTLTARNTELENQLQPMNARLHQMDSALREVREKFGEVKHLQKRAEESAALSESLHAIVKAALNWYIHLTGPIRFNVPFRFHQNTGVELTEEIIIAAYSQLDEQEYEVTSNNLIEYLALHAK